MAESGFEAALEPEARHLYDLLSPEDQRLLDAIIREIEANPYPDGDRRVAMTPGSRLPVIYKHARWWVLYRVAEPGHIAVYAIAPPLAPPDPSA